MQSEQHILTINSGSSSLKFALFRTDEEKLVQSGRIERIALNESLFHVEDQAGKTLYREKEEIPNHEAAIKRLVEWIKETAPGGLDGVGHRMVHGGGRFYEPQRITPDLMETLQEIIPLAPDHLPHELKAIEALRRLRPELPQVACFDTAFHHGLPSPARIYALPRHFIQEGVRRYGFHGLSCEYILEEFRKEAGFKAAAARLIIAHLGNGASITAVRNGKSVDTSMGLTPTGGLVMSTRCGDIDPGVMLYLMKTKHGSEEALSKIVNAQAGLLGLSGISSDMQDLLSRQKASPAAAEAIDLFCYQARKFIGAYIVVLGGLDTLIFTGGIGENAGAVRSRICEGLSFLGIRIDRRKNEANRPVISTPKSPVTLLVMKTNEELMIARHTRRVLEKS